MPRLIIASTVGAAAVAIAPARSNYRIVLRGIDYSYSGVGTGTLTAVQTDSTVLYNKDVSGSGDIDLKDGLPATQNQTVTITLSGIATLIGKLIVNYDIIPPPDV